MLLFPLTAESDGIFSVRFHEEHIAGALLGGAVGDAMGLPVKSMPLGEIWREFGPHGVTTPILTHGKLCVSEITELSLATARGVLRAIVSEDTGGGCSPVSEICEVYQDWCSEQTPGQQTRSLTALCSGVVGSIVNPLNNSRESGAVTRIAPIGLAASLFDPFALGADAAALTHGHPSAYLSAGAFAAIIQLVLNGASLEDAVAHALSLLTPHRGHDEVHTALRLAARLSQDTVPCPRVVQSLGGGWAAEEALAIAIYCALACGDDFAAATRLAVNHSGNSAATAALTGTILGARLGRDAIPTAWLEHLEMRARIEEVAYDLASSYSDEDVWFERYVG